MFCRFWLLVGVIVALALGGVSIWIKDNPQTRYRYCPSFDNNGRPPQCSDDAEYQESGRWAAYLRYGALPVAAIMLAALPFLRRSEKGVGDRWQFCWVVA